MKLRNPLLIPPVAFLLSGVVRVWLGTVTFRFAWDDPLTQPRRMPTRGIYLFWHEMMTFPVYTHMHQGFAVLISHHADGELIAQVVRMFRGRTIRGSTSKGGAAALRGMMRRGKACHVAITPDGPRGPRRVVQPGAIYLASRTGMPIIPVGLAYRQCWRFRRSWDQMAFPHPGTTAQAVTGAPIRVAPDLDRDGIESVRTRVQAAMDDVQRRAERMVGAALVTPAAPAAVTRRGTTGDVAAPEADAAPAAAEYS